MHPSDPTPVRCCLKNRIGAGSDRGGHTCHTRVLLLSDFRLPRELATRHSRFKKLAEGSVPKMFKNFSNSDLAIVALCLEEEDEEHRRSQVMQKSGKRRFWVHSAWNKRSAEGEYFTLLPHLLDDETKFYQYFRMSMSAFNLLELKLQAKLSRQDTYFRKAITSRHRLAVFLR